MLISSFHTNYQAHKEYSKDYTFDGFCNLLIIDQQKLLDEGKLGGKNQSHLLKEKRKVNYKERGQFYIPIQNWNALTEKLKEGMMN